MVMQLEIRELFGKEREIKMKAKGNKEKKIEQQLLN